MSDDGLYPSLIVDDDVTGWLDRQAIAEGREPRSPFNTAMLYRPRAGQRLVLDRHEFDGDAHYYTNRPPVTGLYVVTEVIQMVSTEWASGLFSFVVRVRHCWDEAESGK